MEVLMWLVIGVGIVAFVEFMLIMMSIKQVLFRVKCLLFKKKGAKAVYFFGGDKTIEPQIATPDANNQLKIKKVGYTILKDNILYDKFNDIQSVVCMAGTQTTIDPSEKKKSKLNPQLLEMAIREATLIGMRTAEMQHKQRQALILIIAVAAVAAAVLGYFNMQTLAQVQGGMSSIATMIGAIPQIPIPSGP